MTLAAAIALLQTWMTSILTQWVTAKPLLVSLRSTMQNVTPFIAPDPTLPDEAERNLGGAVPMLIPIAVGWRLRYGSQVFDGASVPAVVTAAQSFITADIAALTATVTKLQAFVTKAGG